MPGLGNMINYDYASIRDCVAEMHKTLTDIESELEDVRGQRRQLVEEGFTGDAAGHYDQKANEIDDVCAGLKHDVEVLGSHVNLMADQMREADKRAGNQFGG